MLKEESLNKLGKRKLMEYKYPSDYFMWLDRGKNITTATKQTCHLYNLIEWSDGKDISKKIEKCIKNGANVGLMFHFYKQTDRTDCNFEDFAPGAPETQHGSYYPIPYACRHHCHPNIVNVLVEHTKKHPKAIFLLDNAKADIISEFSQLYRSPYFVKRASIEGSYHNMMKKLVDSYLCILGLSDSIFLTCDRFRYKEVFVSPHSELLIAIDERV